LGQLADYLNELSSTRQKDENSLFSSKASLLITTAHSISFISSPSKTGARLIGLSNMALVKHDIDKKYFFLSKNVV